MEILPPFHVESLILEFTKKFTLFHGLAHNLNRLIDYGWDQKQKEKMHEKYEFEKKNHSKFYIADDFCLICYLLRQKHLRGFLKCLLYLVGFVKKFHLKKYSSGTFY